MKIEFTNRSWTEISLSTLKRNLDAYRAVTDSEIMAVVKADAYGHGDSVVAHYLQECGIKHFDVSNIDEAIRVRDAGVTGQVLILGYIPIEDVNKLTEYDLTQALLSEEYADLLKENNSAAKCQFAIDTGMRRIGLNADDPENCARIIREYSEFLNIDGIFTHLCVADSESSNARGFTEEQIHRFEQIVEKIGDLQLPWCH